MNVEIGTEAAQFPEKEYIIGIFLAVQYYTMNELSSLYTFLRYFLELYSTTAIVWAITATLSWVPLHIEAGISLSLSSVRLLKGID